MLKKWGDLLPNKPTVLLLPGSLTSPCVYDQVECDSFFQLAGIDYCTSEGPWDVTTLGKRVIEMIDELQLGPTVLAGYSAGGVIAMAAASIAPEKISGLMLSNTGPCGKGHGDPSFPQKILDNWGSEEFERSFFTRCFSRPVPPLLYKRLQAYIRTVDPQAAYEISLSLRNVDFRQDLTHYHHPVVIAHGKADTSRTIAHVEMMKTAMPQAEVFLLDGGHTIMVENKQDWQKAFDHLLQKVRSGMERTN